MNNINVNEAMVILKKSKASCVIRDTICSVLGDEAGREVWNNATVKLAEIKSKYSGFSKGEQMHIESIFNASALYLALKEYSPDKALEIMENGMAVYAKQIAKTFQNMVRMPFGKTFFLKGFAFGAKKMFGESAGFKQKFHHSDNNSLRFDVLECPYVKYTTELGCSEIAHIFCDNDVYTYGHLEGVKFERNQTLGRNGEKCDFYLYKS